MLTADPIGDLFNTPTPVEPKEKLTPAPSAPGNGANLLLIVAIAILAFSMWTRYNKQDGHQKQNDREEQTVAQNEGYMIFVHERQPLSDEQAEILDIADAMHSENPKLEWRSVDDDDPSEQITTIKNFAKSKGVEPPFVVHKTRDGKLRKVITWPADKTALLKVLQ